MLNNLFVKFNFQPRLEGVCELLSLPKAKIFSEEIVLENKANST